MRLLLALSADGSPQCLASSPVQPLSKQTRGFQTATIQLGPNTRAIRLQIDMCLSEAALCVPSCMLRISVRQG